MWKTKPYAPCFQLITLKQLLTILFRCKINSCFYDAANPSVTEKCVNLFMFLLKDDLENPLALKFLRKTKTKQLIKLQLVQKTPAKETNKAFSEAKQEQLPDTMQSCRVFAAPRLESNLPFYTSFRCTTTLATRDKKLVCCSKIVRRFWLR